MKNKIKEFFLKKPNIVLISNVAVILSLITILIGYVVMMKAISKFEKRLQRLELNYSLIEDDFNQLYDIDPGIRKVD